MTATELSYPVGIPGRFVVRCDDGSAWLVSATGVAGTGWRDRIPLPPGTRMDPDPIVGTLRGSAWAAGVPGHESAAIG